MQVIPQSPSLGELLGGGISQGLSSGMQMGINQLLKAKALQATQDFKNKQPIKANDFTSILKGSNVNESVVDAKERGKLHNKFNELSAKYGRDVVEQKFREDPFAFINALKQESGDGSSQGEYGQLPQGQTSLYDKLKGINNPTESFSKRVLDATVGQTEGFKRGMAAGAAGKTQAITSGMPLEEYQKISKLDDKAGIKDNLMYYLGKFVSDSPLYLTGGYLGAKGGAATGGLIGGGPGAVMGGIIGGGAGAFALPTFVNSLLDEFMLHKAKGFKGSFEDYINSANKVVGESAHAGAEGVLFSILGEAVPAIKASSPAMKKFFETSSLPALKEYVGKSTVQTLGLTGAEAAAKRKLPTTEDVLSTAAQVFGFNLMNVGQQKATNFIERVKRAENPKGFQDTMEQVKTASQEAGINEEKLAAGDKAEAQKFDRVVKDITDKYKGKAKVRVPGEELTRESLEAKGKEIKGEAEQLSKAPLEEYLTEKPRKLSATEEMISEQAKGKIEALNDEIASAKESTRLFEERLKNYKLTENNRKLFEEKRIENEKHLKDLQSNLKDLEYTARTGREAFSEVKTKEQAKAHMKELEKAAKDPESFTGKDWKRMFDRDQKYIDSQIEILKRKGGKEPIAPYLDRYLKELEVYNDMYRKSLEKLNAKAESIRPKDKGPFERIRDKIKRNLAINEGKLVKHRDKLQSKEAVKNGPALMRHYLKQLKADLPELKNSMIEANRVLGQTEMKTQSEAMKTLEKQVETELKPQIEKIVEKAFENPTEENLKKADNSIKDAMEKVKEKLEKSAKTPKEKAKINKTIKGIAAGIGKILLKRYYNVDIPIKGLGKLGIDVGGYTSLLLFASRMYDKAKKHITVKNFKKVLATKDSQKIYNYRKQLERKGLTTRQVNNLQKLATT